MMPASCNLSRMTTDHGQPSRPLDGLRVLDLSRAVSGPFAGRILADLGADVVKAELPGTDVAQVYGKVVRGRSGLYSQLNAGKRSILLDLHRPGDVARLLDLAAACDVLVENFRPGVLGRFGAGWSALSAVNPRLVMLSISGFGQDGHDAERAAYAPVIHAEAGLIGRQADLSGDPPADIAFALADTLAGLHGTIAILEAKLRARAQAMAEWIATHADRDALKHDLEAAGLAWADIRHAGDVLAAPSVAGRGTIVEVTDGDGELRSVVRMPYRFSDASAGPVRGVPETGEHTKDVLREWTGIADLPAVPASLLQPGLPR
jgi:CoA:oxalate CoA-transferase